MLMPYPHTEDRPVPEPDTASSMQWATWSGVRTYRYPTLCFSALNASGPWSSSDEPAQRTKVRAGRQKAVMHPPAPRHRSPIRHWVASTVLGALIAPATALVSDPAPTPISGAVIIDDCFICMPRRNPDAAQAVAVRQQQPGISLPGETAHRNTAWPNISERMLKRDSGGAFERDVWGPA